MSNNSLSLSLPYFIAIAIDALGFTIIGPVLVPFVNQLVQNSGLSQHLLYGFILSIYSLSFMLGAPLLGAISDLIGRRKVLIIASTGVLMGYACYAISLTISSLFFLILGRIITGFFAASQCIAQAAMVDLSNQQNRVNNIGLIAAAMTTGLIAGPLVSFALNGSALSISTFQYPFYAICSVLALNLIYLLFFLKESYATKTLNKELKQLKQQAQFFIQQFTDTKLRPLFLSFFLFELGWSLYYQSLAIELPIHLKLEPKTLALFLSFIGLSLTLALVILVPLCSRHFKLNKMALSALFFGVIAFILHYFLKSLFFYYLFGLIITLSVALTYTSLIAELSQQTNTKNQGLLMGSSDAILALAFTITGLLAGYLSYYLAGLSLLTAAVFWLIAWFILV